MENQLSAENDNFARETDIYNGFVTEYNKEITVSEKALDLLTSPSFESYVKSHVGFWFEQYIRIIINLIIIDNRKLYILFLKSYDIFWYVLICNSNCLIIFS